MDYKSESVSQNQRNTRPGDRRNLKHKIRNMGISMGTGVFVGLILGCVLMFQNHMEHAQAVERIVPSVKIMLEEAAPKVSTVDIVAVGDNLIHSGLYKSGLQADGSYNFDHLYANVKADIQAADLAIVNQETIYTYNRNDYSGYPCFAGPVEIGDALAGAGFDVVTHATNHVYDRGVPGNCRYTGFLENETSGDYCVGDT